MNALLSFPLIISLIVAGVNTENPSQKQTLKNTNNMERLIDKPARELQFTELPYSYDALEPYIDQMTMEIHYSRHYRAYYDNFMKAIAGTDAENRSLAEIFSKMSEYPVAIRNNGGGFYNHYLFWGNMTKDGSPLEGKLRDDIITTWGSYEKFQEEFSTAAATRFGSGWAWLSLGPDGKLFISSTPNQDNPLMNLAEKRGIPLLALDVWEHAYYLKYQNKRPEYIKNFWSVVDWQAVSKRYSEALNK